MVKHLKIFIPLFFLVLACQEKDVVPKPEGLIGVDTMTALLTDIHLVEGARTGLAIMGDTLGGITEHYAAFYDKYNVTQAQFDSSFIYYSKNPDVFDGIFEQVIENLSLVESEMKAKWKRQREKKEKREREKVRRDSIQKFKEVAVDSSEK